MHIGAEPSCRISLPVLGHCCLFGRRSRSTAYIIASTIMGCCQSANTSDPSKPVIVNKNMTEEERQTAGCCGSGRETSSGSGQPWRCERCDQGEAARSYTRARHDETGRLQLTDPSWGYWVGLTSQRDVCSVQLF
eukprot:Skav226993  [mRNA]  locus=scaffold5840:9769:13670:- [translate_table: standard]